MARGNEFTRHLLISMDAKGYGDRDDQQHAAIQAGLLQTADTAAARSGLDRSAWDRQGAGDGELARLPHTEPGIEPVIVDDYVREFAAALASHNRDLAAENRLRVRLAVHYGVAMTGPNGWTGQGVVAVSRLVDCTQLRSALNAFPEADLAVVLSRQVYGDVVAQGHTSLKPAEFCEIVVRHKEFTDVAWLRVPGHAIHGTNLGADQSASPEPGGEPGPANQHYRAEAITVVNGTVQASNAVFGIRRG